MIDFVIMAAGSSSRFSSNSFLKPDVKKQWIRINNSPLWLHSLYSLCINIFNFEKKIDIGNIFVTSSEEDFIYMNKLCPTNLYDSISEAMDFNLKHDVLDILYNFKNVKIKIVKGSTTRFKTLKNVLDIVNSEFILVHDCARFNLDFHVFNNLLKTLYEEKDKIDCIVPALKINDTAMYEENHIDRESIRLIQTPQISRVSKLLESYKLNIDFTDESSALASIFDSKIRIIEGSLNMNKITFKQDIINLESKNSDLIGFGSDIHGFIDNPDSKKLSLGGIKIPSKFLFKAHSDGDVIVHAMIDSILGASNCGDIGEFFPDNKAEFKDIDSRILLKRIYDYILRTGLEIINIDITITAQIPKIQPYKQEMQEVLKNILYLRKSQISIKATTPENLGFVGRKEGILAQVITKLKARKIDCYTK